MSMIPAQEPRNPPMRHTWGAGLIAWMLIAFFTLFFLLPGFVMGLRSKISGNGAYLFYEPSNPVLTAYYFPAMKICERSKTMQSFYWWEFRMAGGKQKHLIFSTRNTTYNLTP